MPFAAALCLSGAGATLRRVAELRRAPLRAACKLRRIAAAAPSPRPLRTSTAPHALRRRGTARGAHAWARCVGAASSAQVDDSGAAVVEEDTTATASAAEDDTAAAEDGCSRVAAVAGAAVNAALAVVLLPYVTNVTPLTVVRCRAPRGCRVARAPAGASAEAMSPAAAAAAAAPAA
jgi:hypothetical protein